MKPTVIISCSALKLSHPAAASDLYLGGMFQMLKKHIKLNDIQLLILSAKHGLITGDQILKPYDLKMPKMGDRVAVAEYLERHKKSARKIVIEAAKKSSELYVVLSKDYQAIFDEMIDANMLNKHFPRHYVCRNHRGVFELRSRFNRVLANIAKPQTEDEEIYYRSGIASNAESGYVAAGCHVGTSLAHCKLNGKNDFLLRNLLQSTKTNRVFVDNRLVTSMRRGKPLDVDSVFSQYKQIVECISSRNSRKNISLVIPDDTCPIAAKQIVMTYKKEITALGRKAEIILPIHRCDNIDEHVKAMVEPLKSVKNLRIGIPCLPELKLSMREIEQILSVKISGKQLVRKIHFLGMSEKSGKAKLQQMLLLANIYSISGHDVSFDSCRTPAIFGRTTNSLRQGSKKQTDISQAHVMNQILGSKTYQEHNFRSESTDELSHGFVTSDFYDLICEESIDVFWTIYNRALANHPMLTVTPDDDARESCELAWQVVSQRNIEELLFDQLKHQNWSRFKTFVPYFELSPTQARYEAIQALFEKEKTGFQLPLHLLVA